MQRLWTLVMSAFPGIIGPAGIWSCGEVTDVLQQRHRSRPHGAPITAKRTFVDLSGMKGPHERQWQEKTCSHQEQALF